MQLHSISMLRNRLTPLDCVLSVRADSCSEMSETLLLSLLISEQLSVAAEEIYAAVQTMIKEM